VSAGPLDLYEIDSTSANFIRISSPIALPASYEVIFPLASPAVTTVVQIGLGGVLSFSNNIPEVTAPDYYFTTTRIAVAPATTWREDVATHQAAHNQWLYVASTNAIWAPIQLPVGSSVTEIRLYAQKNTSNLDTIGATVRRSLNGVDSNPPEGAVSFSNADNAPGNVTLSSGPINFGVGFAIEATYQYHLRLEPSGSVLPAPDRAFLVEIDYLRPPP
jgi:hypothetical protein